MSRPSGRRQRVAIVGTGVSGLVCAHVLSREHDVTVFESGAYAGGHTNTLTIDAGGRRHDVDTGFIVFNRENYPNFVTLLRQLGVESQPSDMSFSVQCARTGMEYCGSSLNQLFAQRRNLFRPRMYRMLRDVMRFNREAPRLLDRPEDSRTIGAYLEAERFSRPFVEHYIVPMGAALWSAKPGELLEFPAHSFVRFFHNHGFLLLKGRPEWLVVRGGSRRYVERLIAPIEDRIRLRTPVVGIERVEQGVRIRTPDGAPEHFDAAIVATHSDQALRMLRDPSTAEQEVLGSIPYQENEAVLHGDPSLMPRARRAWSSWNYHVGEQEQRATVTYHMNRLQRLENAPPFFVTLNRTAEIDPEKIYRRITYHHPVYTPDTRRAQLRRDEINGLRHTWYCGAYWGWGFHEDGVRSALAVCRDFGAEL